jgi:lipopolysaccharide cholinephosphotransferase
MGIGLRKIVSEATRQTSVLKELTVEQQKALKTILLDMLKDLINICDSNNYCYMLIGGSALGAVRHSGFIPWDDDLDVGVLRKDYIAFLKTFSEKFGYKYDVVYPDGIHDCRTIFAKIFVKGTKCMEIFDLSTPFHKGVFLDIFPIDSMPSRKIEQKIVGFFFDSISYISTSVLFYKYQNIEFRKIISYNSAGKRHYQMRLVLGFLFSFLSHKRWIYLYDKWISSLSETNFLGIPTGRKHFFGEILDKKVFIPTVKMLFEGIEVSLPGKYERYLENQYGDYMKIPSEDKRERHFIVDFNIDGYFIAHENDK